MAILIVACDLVALGEFDACLSRLEEGLAITEGTALQDHAYIRLHAASLV